MPDHDQAVVPSRLVELTFVAKYQRPWKNDAEELNVIAKGNWHPTSVDFSDIAEVPNKRKRMTSIVDVENFNEFLASIIKINDDTPRPNGSIRRLNLISHANSGLVSLTGKVDPNGTCYLGTPNIKDPLSSEGMDSWLMAWLNSTQDAIPLRDEARKKFSPDAEIWLVVCSGAVGTGLGFVLDLSATFGVKVAAYKEPIYYWPQKNGNRITDRRYTSVGATKDASNNWIPRSCCPKGIGYYCWVNVPDEIHGKHLNNDVVFIKTPPKP